MFQTNIKIARLFGWPIFGESGEDSVIVRVVVFAV
jgi:hypothetical protein